MKIQADVEGGMVNGAGTMLEIIVFGGVMLPRGNQAE